VRRQRLLDIFLFFWLLCSVVSPQSACGEEQSISLEAKETIATLKAITPVSLTVSNDPFYGGVHTYRGYPLQAVMAKLFSEKAFSEKGVEVALVCRDGYIVRLSPEKTPLDNAVLAFEETSAPDGQKWIEIPEGREKITPEPYALIWKSPHPNAQKSYPSPFAIVAINLERNRRSPAQPSQTELFAGYEIYKTRCQQCHSINLDGGVIGPELNVPKNVTEYWKLSDLRALIRDPQTYRYGSRMPPFPDLSEEELSSLLTYIQGMSLQKVCADKARCETYSSEKK
jgi:mono/diheme cytochrome c family protein